MAPNGKLLRREAVVQNVQIDYYKRTLVQKDKLIGGMRIAVEALQNLDIKSCKNSEDFLQRVFDNDDVCNMLINLSRLPVFSKAFALAIKHNLDLLATAKKLKYFTNLSLGQNSMLLKNLADHLQSPVDGMQAQVDKLFSEKKFSGLRLKDYMVAKSFKNGPLYLKNEVALEKIDPHSVYPTSIYRNCDGCTLATPDSQTIEAIMSTSITTTIKITRGVLDPSNMILAEVYKPLGRCIAIVDDKVEMYHGKLLEEYFTLNGITLTKLIHEGNEINKDIRNVEAILVDMKNHGVARNEPVLIVGGGVLGDLGGFATALYHRNTPYVMLCTSIVAGIDAGPSPRTCCDGFGFKNLYGAYHPPVLTLTDRSFWSTLHEGWIRHGIAEIIKMACVKDIVLFELLEKAGPRLIRTKFGTVECDDDDEFQDLCDQIVGRAMESYIRSEYGNLWETHQCRPHAFGHTWSPGYELPAGMLHGHAVASGMGYGAYLSYKRDWITEEQFDRILKLISDMELALWHPVMDNHHLVIASNKKMVAKRGGNLCAPVPKEEIGKCGYINNHMNEDVPSTMNEYKAIVARMPRGGHGIDVHCRDVGLADPSTVATDAFVQIGQAPNRSGDMNELNTYDEWINAEQKKRKVGWENVNFNNAPDTDKVLLYNYNSLFHEGVESYTMDLTMSSSESLQIASKVTEDEKLFMRCMVGSIESQFLKMQCGIMGAKRCLDIGTFTGISALAMAEGIPSDGKVVTLERSERVAHAAKRIFNSSNVGEKIELRICCADQEMREMISRGDSFDIIFIDADKEKYIDYYELSLKLLDKGGIILAGSTLCALLYDQDTDTRSLKLHEFNQYVKNDSRTEQVVLTVGEGITLIKPLN